MAYRILWGFDAIVAAIFVFFFAVGLADGSVSSFNIVLWALILGALGIVLGGAPALPTSGRDKLAIALLCVVAVPGALMGLFYLLILVTHPRSN